MVDATQAGIVCAKVYNEKEMKLVLSSLREMGGELILTQDLILHDTILDEGKSLCLCNKEKVNTLEEIHKELEASHVIVNGSYKPRVEFAFCEMSAMNKMVADIAGKLPAKKEDDSDDEEDKITEKLSYGLKGRDWKVEQTGNDDARKADATIVTGGKPQCLDSEGARLRGRPAVKKITNILTAEPDSNGVMKVYIEDPAVVALDEANISVSFTDLSYHVRADTPSGLLEHGPQQCGEIDVATSKWRLSKGKRVTITLKRKKAITQKMPTHNTETKAAGVLIALILACVFVGVIFSKQLLNRI